MITKDLKIDGEEFVAQALRLAAEFPDNLVDIEVSHRAGEDNLLLQAYVSNDTAGRIRTSVLMQGQTPTECVDRVIAAVREQRKSSLPSLRIELERLTRQIKNLEAAE